MSDSLKPTIAYFNIETTKKLNVNFTHSLKITLSPSLSTENIKN